MSENLHVRLARAIQVAMAKQGYIETFIPGKLVVIDDEFDLEVVADEIFAFLEHEGYHGDA